MLPGDSLLPFHSYCMHYYLLKLVRCVSVMWFSHGMPEGWPAFFLAGRYYCVSGSVQKPAVAKVNDLKPSYGRLSHAKEIIL